MKNKHKYKKVVVSPEDMVKYLGIEGKFPSKYILIYSDYAEEFCIRRYKPEIRELHSILKILILGDIGIVKMTGIGSPHAASIMEELVALGGKQFLNIGTAGGLKHKGIFLCNKALRDEGTSSHYLKPGRFTYPVRNLTARLGKSIKSRGLEYSIGTTWTTDAPYRETKAEVKKYAKQGISTVDMETSALFAVAKYRKVEIAATFVVSDLVCEGKWKPMFKDTQIKETLNLLVEAAVDCLS